MNYSAWGHHASDPSTWLGKLADQDSSLTLEPTHCVAGKTLGLISPEQCHIYVLRTERHKLVYFGNGLPSLLFDLKTDPGELDNLGKFKRVVFETNELHIGASQGVLSAADAAENKAVLVELIQKLLDWKAKFANAAQREMMLSRITYQNQVIYRRRSLL